MACRIDVKKQPKKKDIEKNDVEIALNVLDKYGNMSRLYLKK